MNSSSSAKGSEVTSRGLGRRLTLLMQHRRFAPILTTLPLRLASLVADPNRRSLGGALAQLFAFDLSCNVGVELRVEGAEKNSAIVGVGWR